MPADQLEDLIRRLLPATDEVHLSFRLRRLMISFSAHPDLVTFVAAADGSNNALGICAKFGDHCGSSNIDRVVLVATWPHGFDESFGNLFYDLVLCCIARGTLDSVDEGPLFDEMDHLLATCRVAGWK